MVSDCLSGWVCTVFVLVGCGTKPPPDPVVTVAGQKPCEETASHLLAMLRPGGAEPTVANAIFVGFRDRCVRDKWSLDAAQCFAKLDGIGGASPCAEKLTIAQRDGFVAAIDEATK